MTHTGKLITDLEDLVDRAERRTKAEQYAAVDQSPVNRFPVRFPWAEDEEIEALRTAAHSTSLTYILRIS